MRVRYEDGRETDLTIAAQARIWRNIKLETSRPQNRQSTTTRGPKKSKKAAPKPSKKDKKEGLIVEILEDDKAIFEILTRLVIPPGQIDLYSLFLRYPDEFFSQAQIASHVRGDNLEGQRGVFMAFGRRIAASPDERVRSLQPLNSLFFEHRHIEGKTRLRIRPRIVDIFKSYPKCYDYLINDGRWRAEYFGSDHWQNSNKVHVQQLQFFGLWNRYQREKGT